MSGRGGPTTTAVVAVGSIAVRASGASRWPPSVVLAIGAAAVWPLCATLQRSFPAAVTVAAAAVPAAVAAAAIAAIAPSTVPVLCPIAGRHTAALAAPPVPPVIGRPPCSLDGLTVHRP